MAHETKWEQHLIYLVVAAIIIFSLLGYTPEWVIWPFIGYAAYRFFRYAVLEGLSCPSCLFKFFTSSAIAAYLVVLVYFEVPHVYYIAGLLMLLGHWLIRFSGTFTDEGGQQKEEKKERDPRETANILPPIHPDAPVFHGKK